MTSMESYACDEKDEWAIIAFCARSLLRRPHRHVKATFSVVFMDLCNVAAKRRDIACDLLASLRDCVCEEHTDLCRDHFNTAAYRLADGRMSFIEEAFSKEQLLLPLWGSGCAPEDCCGFIRLGGAGDLWTVEKHGCYELNRELVGLGPKHRTAHYPENIHQVVAQLPNAHKVRSEEATARRRGRRHALGRMQLKRAARAP